jgi:hypothetical protein
MSFIINLTFLPVSIFAYLLFQKWYKPITIPGILYHYIETGKWGN